MAVRTSLVKRRHAYTSVDLPWEMDEDGDARLFRYLRGGGMRAFGTTSAQALRTRRQARFLVFAGAALLVWAVLFFV